MGNNIRDEIELFIAKSRLDINNKYQDLAEPYANNLGYDLVSFAGIENGYYIYNYTHESLLNKKTGIPHYIRIKNGVISEIKGLTNIMHALGMLIDYMESEQFRNNP